MLIRSVTVRSYRTLHHAKVDLTPGLNVIHGENDVGKSTLMDALRAGLVRRAKLSGKLLEAMRPRDGGQPEVEVCFEHGDVVYQVHKKFGPNGSTRLHRRSGKGVFREVAGDPDEALHRVLCFGERLAAGKPNELGILPLLWVRQGTSSAPPRDVVAGETYDALHTRLAELSGPVLAGAGADQRLARVHAEYDRHFQPVLGKVRKGSPLDLAGDGLQAATIEATQLRAQRGELEGLFTRHEGCARDRVRVDALVPDLEAEVERTGALLTAARALHAERATVEAVATGKRLTAEAARGKVAARRERRRDVATLGEELSTGERAASAAEERLQVHDAGRDDLVVQVDAASKAEAAADREHTVARAAVDALVEDATLADLQARRADAEVKQHLVLELSGRLGGMRLGQV
jgi:AAA domain